MIDENSAPYIEPDIGTTCYHCPRTTCDGHFYILTTDLGRELTCSKCGLAVTIGRGDVKEDVHVAKPKKSRFRIAPLSTNSVGAKRLSTLAGSAGAVYGLIYIHKPDYVDGPLVNLVDIAMISGTFFFLGWSFVRLLSWVIDGFRADRRNRAGKESRSD